MKIAASQDAAFIYGMNHYRPSLPSLGVFSLVVSPPKNRARATSNFDVARDCLSV